MEQPGDVMHFYGDERTRRMFAYRSFIDAVLRPPTASDYRSPGRCRRAPRRAPPPHGGVRAFVALDR
jgi:hypothetical protein